MSGCLSVPVRSSVGRSRSEAFTLIENELNDLTGVNVTESDISAKTITVKWDDPATLDMIKNTLNEINYPAQ